MSEKRLDAKNRWRNVVVAFRMSPEEAQELNVKVSLSGLSKQDYIIQCLLKHEIRVVGGMKVAKKVQVHLEPTSAPSTTIRTTHFFTDGFLLETREGSVSDMAGNILPHYRRSTKELLRKSPGNAEKVAKNSYSSPSSASSRISGVIRVTTHRSTPPLSVRVTLNSKPR